MQPLITPQPGIMEIELYQGGASKAAGFDQVLKLSSNENPLGPSQAALAAFRSTANTLHRYPTTDHAELRTAIGEVHGLDPARIICGVGSDEILGLLCYAYAGPGDEIIHTAHGFSMYPVLTRAAGATPVVVAERDRVVDVDAILGAVTERTRLVFVANPGNPSSTRMPDEELARLASELPEDVVLVLDGAYAEFADGYDGGVSLVDKHPNAVMTRTFSKLYGLGGLRIGWGYASDEIIGVLNRLRPPFNLSLTQLATAEAAVRDRAYAAHCVALNAEQRARMVAGLRALGLACDDSETNFVLPRVSSPAQADACEAALRGQGILVRKVGGYGLPDALRITVGDEAGCTRVLDAVAGFLKVAA